MMNDPINQPIRQTPLGTSAAAAGATFFELAGWRVAELFAGTHAELESARSAVVVADGTPNGRIAVQGEGAENALDRWVAASGLAIGVGRFVDGTGIYRLRQDLFFVHTRPGAESGAQSEIVAAAAATGEFVTVTDVTGGGAEIGVIGPLSQRLLSRLCGLDFRDIAFPDLAAKSSRVAKTTQLIIRRDLNGLPFFHLVGEQSLGPYLWATILEAGADLDVRPVGQKTLDQLST